MRLSVQTHPPMPTRPCRFCLSLQDGSVFADFDVDEKGGVFLRRISFDGYGCCNGAFRTMNAENSEQLIDAVEHGSVDEPSLHALLRDYFRQHVDMIWPDALVSHELL